MPKIDPKTKEFMKMWCKTMGVKFVNIKTGEELDLNDSEDDSIKQD